MYNFSTFERLGLIRDEVYVMDVSKCGCLMAWFFLQISGNDTSTAVFSDVGMSGLVRVSLHRASYEVIYRISLFSESVLGGLEGLRCMSKFLEFQFHWKNHFYFLGNLLYFLVLEFYQNL